MTAAILTAGLLTPAPAGATGAAVGAATPVVGGFGIGDGLEGTIDERVGAFRFVVPVGGLELVWDSRAMGADRDGLGAGWSWGLGRVLTTGGVRVQTGSGGVFEADATAPSGLAGYGPRDVAFARSTGVLPSRGAGAPAPPEPVEYAYVLHELGGVVTYYSADGDPAARIDRFGARTDWLWQAPGHRLVGVVDPNGLLTELDWEAEPGGVVVRPGANLAEPAKSTWRVDIEGGRVVRVTDASGGRISFGYDGRAGLVTTVAGTSGGITRVAWQGHADARTRVSSVTTTDADGAELSRRDWEVGAEGALPSGWPGTTGETTWTRPGGAHPAYRAILSDGATQVISEYSSRHLLTRRSVVATSTAGDTVIHDQVFSYPADDGVPIDPGAPPGNWMLPTAATTTVRDPAGRERVATETLDVDARGRVTRRTEQDGTVTATEYDETVPPGALLPIGLPVAETRRGPDGRVQTIRHTLNRERTAATASETLQGTSAEALAVTARSEFDLRADGFTTARRALPAGTTAQPAELTTWDLVTDTAAGTRMSTETVGAGTPAAATTTEVTSLVHGGVLSSTDPLGNTVRTTYDPIGRPVLTVDARGRRTAMAYETVQRHGRNAVTTTGPDGVAHTEVRDALGRSIRTTDSIQHGEATAGHLRVVESRADPEPGTVAVTDAWGATTITRQDLFGRTTAVVAPSGLTKLTEYDDVGNTVSSALTPTGRAADAEFVRTETRDAQGRPVAATGRRADGVAVPEETTAYDGLGRMVGSSNGAVDTRIEYDEFGRPTHTTIDDATATRRFDGYGRSLEKTVSGAGDARSGGIRAHDELGRIAVETDQTGRAETRSYTVDGLLQTRTTTDGARTEHTYDPVTRQPLTTTVSAPGREPVRTAYRYDPVTDRVIAVFDPAAPDATTIGYQYDAFGNRTSVTYPDGAVVRHHHDAHGRRVATTEVTGATTRYEHTVDGLLTRARQTARDGRLLAEVTYEYDGYHRVTRIIRGNGLVTEYTFTAASEIATETTEDASGVTRAHRAYEYDPRGNLVRRTDRTDVAGGGDATTTEYSYDGHDRLVRSVVREAGEGADAVLRETDYELSAPGDVRTETVTSAPGTSDEHVTTHSYEYGARGELTARTTTEGTPAGERSTRREQRWDEAGNLLHGIDGHRHGYDAADRPVRESTADGSTIVTRYWADGTRRDVATTATAGATETTTFYWAGDQLVNDVHTGSDPELRGTATYLLGLGRHTRTTSAAQPDTTATSYYGTDRHGSITDTTDETGATTRRLTYADYGAVGLGADLRPGLGRDPFGYAGEYTDATGRQHLRARTYDPTTLQFTSRDDADRHNRYAYADLNPIMRTDPTGRAPAPDAWHPVMLGLSLFFTVVIGVAAVAAVPGTLGGLGIGAAVTGVLADAYSFAVSLGGLITAADSARTQVDPAARRFFESDVAWASELVMGVSLVAALHLTAKAAPRITAWYRATFHPPAAPGPGPVARIAHPIALRDFTSSQEDALHPVTRDAAPSALATEWMAAAELMRSAPLSTMGQAFEDLLQRTRRALAPDPFASVARVTGPGGEVRYGFRAWLERQGVPAEIGDEIYRHSGSLPSPAARSALAVELKPVVATVWRRHGRLQPRTYYELPGGKSFLDVEHRWREIDDLLGRISQVAGDPWHDAF